MSAPRYPALIEINTRVRLTELSAALGRPATLDDIPDSDLDQLARDGFDLVWLLGVWQTGPGARAVSLANPDWLAGYRDALPDFTEADVTGSPFAVRSYHVHRDFGGDEALARLRERLRLRRLRLILDFVPNHVAPDHPWVEEHPDFFIEGTAEQLEAQTRRYMRLESGRILAHGRDPYFDGWPDTLQLNYAHPALQETMLAELQRIAAQCDGLRCDMAMLVLPEIFQRTWGSESAPFWPRAIPAVKNQFPGFLFLAEVYWDLEWTLIEQGFDYAYDKRLYDRLVEGKAAPVREHLKARLDFQDHLVRFLENHDEPRAAAAFPPEAYQAAAVITYFAPGLRFFHRGQREGRRVRVPAHLGRAPTEAPNTAMAMFYDRLMSELKGVAFRDGLWQLLEPRPAWEGNRSNDAFVIFSWTGPGNRRRLVAVNYAPHPSQCYVSLPWDDLADQIWQLHDRLNAIVYDRDGDDLTDRGLYLDIPAWGYNVFRVEPF